VRTVMEKAKWKSKSGGKFGNKKKQPLTARGSLRLQAEQ